MKLVKPKLGRIRYKEALYATLLLFLSILFAAAAAEVVLRTLGHHGVPMWEIENVYYVDDPILNWRHVPNSEHKEGKVIYKYNGSGFRDVDHFIEKPTGIKRIVVIGDSVAEGYGVESSAVFSRVLQRELGTSYEVINIAAGGLNTPQEIHLFEHHGAMYAPDVVVLNFVLNDGDFYSNIKAAEAYQARKDAVIGLLNIPINPKLKRMLKSSALIYFVKERVEDLKGRIAGVNEGDYFVSLWEKEETQRKIELGFDQLAGLRERGRFDGVVVIWPLVVDYGEYRYRHIHEWVREQGVKRGFKVFDLLPKFSKVSYRQLQVTSEDSVHPNAFGHRLAADAFLAWYRSHDVE